MRCRRHLTRSPRLNGNHGYRGKRLLLLSGCRRIRRSGPMKIKMTLARRPLRLYRCRRLMPWYNIFFFFYVFVISSKSTLCRSHDTRTAVTDLSWVQFKLSSIAGRCLGRQRSSYSSTNRIVYYVSTYAYCNSRRWVTMTGCHFRGIFGISHINGAGKSNKLCIIFQRLLCDACMITNPLHRKSFSFKNLNFSWFNVTIN